jgi:hypothetical protein
MYKLTPTPSDLDCHFRGTAGQQATLAPSGIAGQVLFGETTYGNVQVVAKGQTAAEIKITVQAGRVPLVTVYFFSLGPTGRGKLLEKYDGGASQELRDDLRGDQPAVIYQVCGGAV